MRLNDEETLLEFRDGRTFTAVGCPITEGCENCAFDLQRGCMSAPCSDVDRKDRRTVIWLESK